jgi:hypothetical protein
MASPGSGLSQMAGLSGFVNSDPEADAFDVQGGPVNPAHAQFGEQSEPYSWESKAVGSAPRGPIGPENELLGEDPAAFTFAAGDITQDPTGDQTPYQTHAGPFPKGRETSIGPDATGRQLRQNYALHSIDTNAAASRQSDPTMLARQDEWNQIYEIGPGSSGLVEIPDQIKGAIHGFGNTDRTQSFARQNEYGFDSKHQHRRYASGPIPGNFMWMRPAGRPMVRSLPGPARPPVGPGSPFYGQDTGAAFDYVDGGILQDSAVQYEAPPVPYFAPSYGNPDDTSPEIPLW